MTAEARQTVKTALEALEELTAEHRHTLEDDELDHLTLAETILRRALDD